jgi:circadian clock protein KaiB
MMPVAEEYRFILFISGMSVKSVRAIENLKHICDEKLAGKFSLQIIDISKEKEKALEYQVFALPTLIKLGPEPVRTILGDLSDREKVLRILEIND